MVQVMYVEAIDKRKDNALVQQLRISRSKADKYIVSLGNSDRLHHVYRRYSILYFWSPRKGTNKGRNCWGKRQARYQLIDYAVCPKSFHFSFIGGKCKFLCCREACLLTVVFTRLCTRYSWRLMCMEFSSGWFFVSVVSTIGNTGWNPRKPIRSRENSIPDILRG